jgi:Tol biopolymer transport system component
MQDAQPLWERAFVQLWSQTVGPDGETLAAVVAPEFGKWTVAVNGTPWGITFPDLVSDIRFSPDGRRVGAVTKSGQSWGIAIDGAAWRNRFEMAWPPVFSPDGRTAAAKVERNGRYTVAVNDRIWPRECDAVWGPLFSPDGTRILIRSIEDGVYHRRVLPVADGIA